MVPSPAFSIEELLNNYSREELIKKGVYIDEIPQNSLLHLKKSHKEMSKQDLPDVNQRQKCFMQLTFGYNIMVYDLNAYKRCEVAMIHDVN